jgi:probable blue pigment (indigoidine) exporter
MSSPGPSAMGREPSSASLLAVLAMVGWGAAYVPSAWLVETWPPLIAAAARIGIGGLILLIALRALGRPVMPGTEWRVILVLALTQSVAFYGATFIGIAKEGAGIAAVLANTDPLFVAALAALFLGEHLNRRQWAGLLVGVVGATVVVWKGPLWPPSVSLVSLLVVGGALAWAVGTVAVAGRIRSGARPVAIAGWQMLIGASLLAALGLAFEGVPATTGGREVILVMTIALVGSAIPFALFYVALGRGDAGRVSAWFFLVPVIGVLTAWPLLGEAPGPRLWTGLILVCAGLWMVLAPSRRW